jgi:hypothetical protein
MLMSPKDPTTALIPEQVTFRGILSNQIQRYPQLEIQDLYKLIFQASFGSEHAVAGRAAAHRWLERELRELAPGPEEPIIDPISPDGSIVRINLRPYLAARKALACLLAAFARTARGYHGTEAALHRYWHDAEHMAAAGLLPFAPEALHRFFAEMQAASFPAVHHSAAYTAAYHPAYRVVRSEFLGRS